MVSVERFGGAAVVTLSSPPANAFNGELVARLVAILDEVGADDNISVVHFRSAMKIFCAGADLSLMRRCFSTPEGPEAMLQVVRDLQRLLVRIESAPFVSIAEIGGAALGGGLEFALACDLRVAAADAKLGLPEVGLGLIPGAGGTQRMTKLCGAATAKRLILGAEVLDGALAEKLGIVQWSHPRANLAEWTRNLAERIAAMPRAALAAAKSCIAAQSDMNRNGYEEEIEETRRLYNHPVSRKLVADFLSKSPG